ncbi:MAG: hypothetical protein JNL20_07325, partial [Thauera sp.]|nr:hypothetical protein [Thauera sp.]
MMTNYEYSLIASAAFILALTAYPEHAEIKGWRTGAVFAKPATKITFMSGLLSIAVVIHVIAD